MLNQDNEINSKPFSVQIGALGLGAVGSVMILISLIVPFLSGLRPLMIALSVLMIALGYLFFKLAYAFAMGQSKKVYWLTIFSIAFILLLLARKVFFSFEDFPNEQELQSTKGEYKAARVLLNAILLAGSIPIFLSLLREKVRSIYKS